jgi:hypothetical protein
MQGWTAFFSTAAESAATLAGLVIVAISVNITRILEHKHLPARAWAAISAMILVLAVSLCALIPQPPLAFAVEVDLAAAYGWVTHVLTAMSMIPANIRLGRPRYELWLGLFVGQSQVLPLTAAAVLLTLGHPSGMFWLAAALFAAVAATVMNAWVLLVEILR